LPLLRRITPLLILCLLLNGCAADKKLGERRGPTAPVAVAAEPWSYDQAPGWKLSSPHYTVHTTISDLAFAKSLVQLLEAGYFQYQAFTPGIELSDKPMDCYIFANRAQWADFTQKNTGATAKVFLQINRGGYTVRDWFVAYELPTRYRTYSVVAHEGFHQFASRNFVGRLPPFLEEGLACMFEDIDFEGSLPRFNLSVNRNRAHALRRAIEHKSLIPLDQLVTMHAGEIVSHSGITIETFYAQNWAFARFLWEGEKGIHRPGLQKFMTDTAKGTIYDPTRSLRSPTTPWNPAAVPLILERYFGMSFDELAARYQAYLRTVAYDELEAQFAS
jgi:hypothetical protein